MSDLIRAFNWERLYPRALGFPSHLSYDRVDRIRRTLVAFVALQGGCLEYIYDSVTVGLSYMIWLRLFRINLFGMTEIPGLYGIFVVYLGNFSCRNCLLPSLSWHPFSQFPCLGLQLEVYLTTVPHALRGLAYIKTLPGSYLQCLTRSDCKYSQN